MMHGQTKIKFFPIWCSSCGCVSSVNK